MKHSIITLAATLVLSLSAVNAMAQDMEYTGHDASGRWCSVHMHVTKTTTTPTVPIGTSFTQLITVTNTGTCDITDFRLVDYLSSYATFVSATPTPNVEPAVGAFGGEVIWYDQAIASGESLVYEVTVTGESNPNLGWFDRACAYVRSAERWKYCGSLFVHQGVTGD